MYDEYDEIDFMQDSIDFINRNARRVKKLHTVTGTVQDVKFNKVVTVNGIDYSAFSSDQLNYASPGDQVTFDYTENVSPKNGKTYLNIKGKVNVMGKGSGGTTTVASGTRAAPAAPPVDLPPHYTTAKGYLTLTKQYPVPKDHPDRSIIRQNAGNIAATLLAPTLTSKSDPSAVLETWKEMADFIESQTSGDLDHQAAVAALEELSKTE